VEAAAFQYVYGDAAAAQQSCAFGPTELASGSKPRRMHLQEEESYMARRKYTVPPQYAAVRQLTIMSARRSSGRALKQNTKYYNDDFETVKKKKKVSPAAAAAGAAPLTSAAADAPSTTPPSPPPESPLPESPPPPSPPRSRASSSSEESDDEEYRGGPLTEKDQIRLIQKYYSDDSFSGAYTGVQNLKRSLLTEKHLNVPLRVVVRAVSEIPSYVRNVPPIQKYPRARYDVSSLGQLFQADLGFVEKKYIFGGYIGFLLAIDCFSVSLFRMSILRLLYVHFLRSTASSAARSRIRSL
jgi:hypothetical protein